MQWKLINELTGSASDKSVTKVEVDNEMITEPRVVAETINDYLISVQDWQTAHPVQRPRLYTYPRSFFIAPSN
ncbi:hypothetical protein J6590_107553, partial [Homalodisca vitripennis]